MKNSLIVRLLSSSLVLLLSLQVAAQTTPSAESGDGASAVPRELSKAEKEKKGLEVLRAALMQSRDYSAPANRIYIGSLGASLLWPHDAAEARALLADVRGRLKELGAQPITDEGQLRTVQMVFSGSRQLAVQVAAYDPAAALEFLRATEPPKGLGLENDNLEISVAAVAAREHPKEAEKLAAENLQTGDVILLAGSIQAIAGKDPAGGAQLANQLVDRVIANLPNEGGTGRAIEFLQFAGSGLFDRKGQSGGGDTATFPADSLRPLAMALLNASRSQGFPSEQVDALRSSLPMLQKLVPAEAAAFARAHPPRARDESGGNGAFQIVSASNRPEQQATDADPAAEFVLSNDVSLDEVRRLIGRSRVSQQEQQRALQAAEAAGRTKSQQKRQPGNSQPPAGSFVTSQVNFYLQWANSLLGRKDTKNAAALLEDARTLLPSEPESARQMDLLAQIATMYCDLDRARAAEIGLALIRKFNEIAPSILTVGDFLMRDEMTVMQNGELLLSPFVMGVREEIPLLTKMAQSDPEAAVKLADELQRPEIRTLAYLQIARALLDSENRSWSPRRSFAGVAFVTD